MLSLFGPQTLRSVYVPRSMFFFICVLTLMGYVALLPSAHKVNTFFLIAYKYMITESGEPKTSAIRYVAYNIP